MDDDFIIKFEFDKQNEWQTLRKSTLFYLGTILGFLYYLMTNEPVGLYIGFGLLVFIVPQIILHLQYRLTDRDKTITINHSKRTVRIEHKGMVEDEFNFSEIDKMIRRKGQKDEDNMIYALPTFFYNYTEILLKNGKRINYSDFLAKNIGLRDIEIQERISLLNFIG